MTQGVRRQPARLLSKAVKRPPTDFELLRAIYERHKADYVADKIQMPIDIPAVATELGVEPNSVFGRLYHHLEQVYGEPPDPEGRRPHKFFFTAVAGQDINCVNFPLLEAVLAALWQQRDRDLWTYRTSILSLVISAVAVVISILVATGVIG
jgi:hypothetical protein